MLLHEAVNDVSLARVLLQTHSEESIEGKLLLLLVQKQYHHRQQRKYAKFILATHQGIVVVRLDDPGWRS